MASPIFFIVQFLSFFLAIVGASAQGGSWQILNNNIGISCMHAAVTRWNTVVCLDRTDIGPSNLTFPTGHPCRTDPNDMAKNKTDCTAHSCVFDLQTNQCRPLMIQTDTWCSSGQFLPNGSLLQTGGYNDGSNKFRMFDPCRNTGSCDWYEFPDTMQLSKPRWYATNQVLPDGTIIIIGGISQNSLEYYPPRSGGAVNFPFLGQTTDNQLDNLYPYVHLLPNGYLFIFANNQSVLYNYTSNAIMSYLPVLEGGARNYPSGGSSAMLALETGHYSSATIIICGGAQYDVYYYGRKTVPGKTSCGRINATDANPIWEMEEMPFPRIMGEMVMLPTGDLCIINGAQNGSQGYGFATNPYLNPVLYQPKNPMGSRFTTLNPTTTPRLYHSTANLLPDGRIMVAGSNTHLTYTWDGTFPTVLSVEAFSPDYLSASNSDLRPVLGRKPGQIGYGGLGNVYFNVKSLGVLEVNIASAPYSTHSFSQGQRLVKLKIVRRITSGAKYGSQYRLVFQAPPNGMVAPPGFYMVFVVNQGVPSEAFWVSIS